MERKWIFLRNCCEEIRRKKAAKVAQEIDDALMSTYEEEHTEDWEDCFEDILGDWDDCETIEEKIFQIVDIAETSSYCVGCMKDNCEECAFMKVAGKCTAKGSLFDKFHTALTGEHYAKEGEKVV